MSLVIRRSKIHADGVYSTAPIKKKHIVVEYTGPRLTNDQADAIYDHSPRTYLFGLTDGEHVIDGDNIAAFINHSCDPNCEAYEEDGRVFIHALRDIEKGEELNYNYALIYEARHTPAIKKAFACYCGAANCTGVMLAPKKRSRKKAAAD